MANKNKSTKVQGLQQTNVRTVHSLEEFKEVSSELRSQGYIALPGALGGGSSTGILYSYEDYLSSRMTCECDGAAGGQSHVLPLLHVSSGAEVKESSCGTKDLGYITWGWGNRLPNVVSLFTDLLPYTAGGQKFLNDLLEGMGAVPMLHYTQYVGGNITEKDIPFAHAGTLLKGQIRDLQQQLLKLEEEHPEIFDGSITSSAEQMHHDLKEQIQELRDRLTLWERVNKEVDEFTRNSNLHATGIALASDLNLLWQMFPEIELSRGSYDEKTGDELKKEVRGWHPRATGLRYRSAHICRKERMDNENKSRYVYLSNQWLDQPNTTPDSTGITALPAISAESPTKDLERLVRKNRWQRNPNNRPTRIIFPVSYPSPGRPYYPIPAWHSIFAGDIYLYAATLISDRKKRRDNANVIGRILYLSDDYVQRVYQQRNLVKNEDKKKFFNDEIITPINNFLKNRDNNGKPMLAYTFTGADGKTYKSWEIVEIEENSKSAAEANKEELAEISSIIFFAMGLDSQLVGNTPGTTVRSGGTDLRERYLLKQIQMSTMQQLFLKPLEVISQFNGWDKAGLVWRIKREVLTTLDNSKTGITTAETE